MCVGRRRAAHPAWPRAAQINTARYEFSLAKHLPAPEKGVPQLVALRTTPSADGDKRKISVGAKAHRGEFAAEKLHEFLTVPRSGARTTG